MNRHPKPLVGGAIAYDVACFQLNHTVGMFQLVLMVRDENDGGAAVLEFVQHPHDVGAPLRVEHGGRLVEHEQIDFSSMSMHSRSRDCSPPESVPTVLNTSSPENRNAPRRSRAVWGVQFFS